MRTITALLVTLLMAGCGGEDRYKPSPPQPDTSLSAGDEGVLRYASVICNSVELYRSGNVEADSKASAQSFDTIAGAIKNGNCTPVDEKNLAYTVIEIDPIEKVSNGCKLIYMTTIETEKYGVLYTSSDKVPGMTKEQIEYRSDCLKKLRAQNK